MHRQHTGGEHLSFEVWRYLLCLQPSCTATASKRSTIWSKPSSRSRVDLTSGSPPATDSDHLITAAEADAEPTFVFLSLFFSFYGRMKSEQEGLDGCRGNRNRCFLKETDVSLSPPVCASQEKMDTDKWLIMCWFNNPVLSVNNESETVEFSWYWSIYIILFIY